MTAAGVAAMLQARPTGPGRWRARCPAHEDRTPSLDIREGDDGRTLLLCRAGCLTTDLLRAAGLAWSDLFPDTDVQIARQLARAVAGSADSERDPAMRAEIKLRDFADPEGRRISNEILLRNKKITHAEKILERDRKNENGWRLLEEAYQGLAQLEFLADLLNSRNPKDWLEAKRWIET